MEFRTDFQTRNCELSDGYTFVGYIEPEDRLHDGLMFEYRRMLFEDVVEMDSASQRLEDRGEPKQAERLKAATISKHIKRWSEVDENGKMREVSADNLRHIGLIPFRRLTRIVAGSDPSDEMPGSPIVGEGDSIDKTIAKFHEKAGVSTDATGGDVGN